MATFAIHQIVKISWSQSCLTTRHAGAWGERRYSSYAFSTSALDGGEWSASHPGRALTPGKGHPVYIVQETGWAPEPVWTQRSEEKSSCPYRGSNLDHPVVQPQILYWLSYRLTLKISTDLNFCMLCCGNKTLWQKTVHSHVVYYVHVLLYNTAKPMFHYIKSYYNIQLNKDKHWFSFVMLHCSTFQ
jgi:hypothetical protein